tara:strand:+ start:843 stop:1349 length:507 start_codon:yes stop_codon:yes gene_type:complete
MKKILYCDVDSTINNHWERIKKWALPSFPGHEIHPNAFTREEIMKDIPIDGAVDSLNLLSNTYEIHYLTARNFSDAFDITKDWLEKYEFPIDSINVVARSSDKPEFLKDKKCDVLIDDFSAGQEHGPSFVNLYHNTIQKLDEYQIPYIIFKGFWSEVLYLLNVKGVIE